MILFCVLPDEHNAPPDDTIRSAIWTSTAYPTATLYVGPHDPPDVGRRGSHIRSEPKDAFRTLFSALPALSRRDTTVERVVVVTADGLFVGRGFDSWLVAQPLEALYTIGSQDGMNDAFMAFPATLPAAISTTGYKLRSRVGVAKAAVAAAIPVVRWGTDGVGCAVPPLYVSEQSPDPRLLGDAVLFFSGLSKFRHEEDIRNSYRLSREEPASPISVLRPYPVTNEVDRWVG